MKALNISLCVLAPCVLAAIAVLPSLPLAGASVAGQSLQPRDGRLLQVTNVLSTTLTAGYPLTITAATIFVPVVTRNYRSRPSCTPNSPFGLQIAALHEVQPPDGGAYALEHLTEAEWLALYEDAFPTLMEALENSGACWARVRIDWAWIQPDPPPAEYVWGPYHDEKLALVAETGVQLIAHIDDVPFWAGPSALGPIDEDQLAAFAQFLTDVVNRYKQPPYNINTWELFNEPDWTSADGERGWGKNGDKYATMLARAYVAIKLADPQATVLMGGVAYDWFTECGGPFYRYFPDDVMDAAGDEFVEALNFHYFPDFSAEWERWVPDGNPPTCGDVEDGVGTSYDAWGIDVIAKANHFRNRMYTCYGVDKPVWLTETGQHGRAGDPTSLAEQARYVVQVYARGLAAGLEKIIWYALVSPPYDPNGQGLLYKDDWSPKPAFHSYRTLTCQLAGYEYAHTLQVPDGEGYVFRKADLTEKTVAWGGGRLRFTPASVLHIVDLQGSVTWVMDGGPEDADGVQNGTVTLQLSDNPVFVSRK